MEKFKVITLLALLVSLAQSEPADVCPEYCACELVNGRNHADCSGRNLLNGYIEIPLELETLDLSNNEIMQLDKFCFQNYTNLIELNLEHNAIKSIDLYSFMHLRLVETINLAYNHLESFDNRLFEMNRRLHTLNLEGNKFMMLPNEPLIKSVPLRTLNLRNCQLNFLEAQFFVALPQLQHIDVSYNLFITLNVEAFSPCNQLLELNIVGNLWNCEHVEHDVIQLRNRQVQVIFDDCEEFQITPSEASKFERMQLPSKPHNPWRRIFNEDDSNEDILGDADAGQFVCEVPLPQRCLRYRKCLADVVLMLEENTRKYNEVSAAQYSEQDVNFAYLVGIAAGVTTIVIILTAALCFKACLEMQKKPPPVGCERQDAYAPHVPPRARRTRRRELRSRALTRSHQIYAPGADNFISRLFGRPARHQYYRTLNQNTATLIRRLSRSNLFNNRLSQNFERQRSTVENVLPRSETPPPTYGEVITIHN